VGDIFLSSFMRALSTLSQTYIDDNGKHHPAGRRMFLCLIKHGRPSVNQTNDDFSLQVKTVF
jgi:hypothetical protein